MNNDKCAVIIVAAGSGKRMGSGIDKQFINIDGMSVIERSVKKFAMCEFIDNIIVVSSKENIADCRKTFDGFRPNCGFSIILGGKERQNSVYNGLKELDDKCEYVMIHDGARPFVDHETIKRVFDEVLESGACVPAVPVKDTIKRADREGFAAETLKRNELWAVQTPQAFRYDVIKKAYDNMRENEFITDDASAAELSGVKVKIVMGSYNNIKITTPEDLPFAKAIAEKDNETLKINTKEVAFLNEKSGPVQKRRKLDIYTDGACSGNPGKGGYGAVLIYNGKRREISAGYELTTNNRMELLSVIESLSMLKEPCDVDLYSDSKYVVDAVSKGWMKKWEKNGWMRTKTEKALNSDLWIRLSELLKKHNVNFIWVKGHADNVENERCDELARNAITCQKLFKDEGYGC